MRAWAMLAAVAAQLSLPGLGEFTQDDIANQVKLVEWVDRAYYSTLRTDTATWEAITGDVWRLAELAQGAHPELSLGVGLILYSFFWWKNDVSDEWNVDAITKSAGLFARSIMFNGCDSAEMNLGEFLGRQCHVRWRYVSLLSAELGRYLSLHRMPQAAGILQSAAGYFEVMRSLPFFKPLEMALPHDSNFNGDHFPMLAAPQWRPDYLPMSRFLKQHFTTFRQELDAILAKKPGSAFFTDMYLNSRNAETQFGPRDLDWETVYFLRDQKWNDMNSLTPRRRARC